MSEIEWIRIEGKTLEEINGKFPKIRLNETLELTMITFDKEKQIYFMKYRIIKDKEEMSELDKFKIGIHEIKEYLQKVQLELFERDWSRSRSYSIASRTLEKMFKSGLIDEYIEEYNDEKGRYKLRYYDKDKKEKIRVD